MIRSLEPSPLIFCHDCLKTTARLRLQPFGPVPRTMGVTHSISALHEETSRRTVACDGALSSVSAPIHRSLSSFRCSSTVIRLRLLRALHAQGSAEEAAVECVSLLGKLVIEPTVTNRSSNAVQINVTGRLDPCGRSFPLDLGIPWKQSVKEVAVLYGGVAQGMRLPSKYA